MKAFLYILGGLFTVALTFICVDCSCGHTIRNECTVLAHQYKPAWTEVSTYTDSDGNSHVSTTYHPEEYHVICSVNGDGPERYFDCNESSRIYYAVTNQQQVIVSTREGKWTSFRYIPSIDL